MDLGSNGSIDATNAVNFAAGACGREYEIVAYNATTRPWQEGRRYRGLSVNREGVTWGPDAPEAVVMATASAKAPGLRH